MAEQILGCGCEAEPHTCESDADRRIAELEAENERLRGRRDELLALVARISQETPLPAELEGWEGQRASLIAEVGTLRARVAELEASTAADYEAVNEAEMETVRVGAALDSLDAEHTVLVDQMFEVAARADVLATFQRADARNVERFAVRCMDLRDDIAARDHALDACAARIAELLAAVAASRLENRTLRRHLHAAETFLESFRGLTEVHLGSMERLREHAVAMTEARDAQADLSAALLEDAALLHETVCSLVDEADRERTASRRSWPSTLGGNLAIAGALKRSYQLGCGRTPPNGEPPWRPGCGRSVLP